MKSYTDIEQSKKLAEVLPIESADMGWNVFVDGTTRILPINDWDLIKDGSDNVKFYSAWSLAALLEVIYYPILIQEYDGKWSCIEFQEGKEVGKCETPIDACYEMIIKLHEQNLL